MKKTAIKDVDQIHIEKYGRTFHASLVPTVRCYIDKAVVNDKGEATIEGWVFHETDSIKTIRVKNYPLSNQTITKTTRKDVEDFYNPYSVEKVGFTLTIVNTKLGVGDQLILDYKTSNDDEFTTFETCTLNPELSVNDNAPNLIVVDNFYNNPDAMRSLALNQDFVSSEYHKGKRTAFKYCVDGTKEKIEKLLGLKITDWDNQPHNTVFQYCTPADALVYHYDGQTHAAVVFLTPDAPPETGTSFYRHKGAKWLDRALEIGKNGVTSELHLKKLEQEFIGAQHDDFLDGTKWEEVDRIGNKYNRFAMWDAKQIHAASKYFGNSKESGRLFHMFFFNAK